MYEKPKNYSFLLFLILILSFFLFYNVATKARKTNANIKRISRLDMIQNRELKPASIKEDIVQKIEIVEKATFGELLKEYGVDSDAIFEIYNASKEVYDLSQIRLGYFIRLIYSPDNELKELKYKINTEEELSVKNKLYILEDDIASSSSEEEAQEDWIAERISIDYDIQIKTAGGVVETSMYEAAIKNDIDIRAIIELANAFQWTIDFALDPRVGDTFKFIFEERYLNGSYMMPGMVLAGVYVNDGEPYEIYYFEETKENIGYFDAEGNSVQKMFLRAPVSFKYISSGFTTGRRFVEAFNVSTGHRAIDYATVMGTPIRSVGDGRVIFAGWSPIGYGYLTKIRHNGTYTTNYAHQSRILVKRGQRIKQGQIIGKVGSTGFSTGPHLHYEMVKNGVKINPLREVLPPGQKIKEENKERFFKEISKYGMLKRGL